MTALHNKKKNIFLVVLILLYPLLFIWQGGDLTDTGFFALNYQTFFSDISQGKVDSISIMSDFIGALWIRLFPNGGILGLEVLNVLVLYIVVFATYELLKDFVQNKTVLLFGLLCGIAYSIAPSILVFSRDDASFFFLKYYKLNKGLYLILSGMMFLFSFIARIPNIVFIGLLPLLLIYKNFYKIKNLKNSKGIRQTFTEFSLFCLGFATVAIGLYWILKTNGIWDIYLNNLNLFKANSKSSYTFSRLIRTYFDDFIRFYPHLIVVSTLILPLSILSGYSKFKKNTFYLLLPVILLFIAAFFIYKDFAFDSKIRYLVPAFCALPLLLTIFRKDKYGLPAVVLIAIAISHVVGSNTGLFLKLSYGFTVLIPLSIVILQENRVLYLGNLEINTKPFQLVGISFILFFSLWTRVGWVYGVDRGIMARTRCIYPIENNQMKGIFTTEKNAASIKLLSASIQHNIKSNNTLFIYGHKPLFYFLTVQKPPVDKFWLINDYVEVDELFSSLEESISLKKKYPLIVDTKENILGESGQKRLNAFFSQYNYTCVVDNQAFSIWRSTLQ